MNEILEYISVEKDKHFVRLIFQFSGGGVQATFSKNANVSEVLNELDLLQRIINRSTRERHLKHCGMNIEDKEQND